MFDVGFWELSLIGVIGLLVLGPERLPGVARVAGGYLRKARKTWANVRGEISRELAAEEFKAAVKEPMEELRSAIRQPAEELDKLRRKGAEKIGGANDEAAVPKPDKPDDPQPGP